MIEIKSRELDVAQQADTALLRFVSMPFYRSSQCVISGIRAALTKWKISRRRHVEELSLLENYLLVKREGWLLHFALLFHLLL